ncbi:MAG: methionyl-tRNA formyltransferase [Methyloligellaceae bacterium]
MRLVFMGTPDFAVPTLTGLIGAGYAVAGVYTQPPRPAGRGMAERRSPVHAVADQAGLPVFTPTTLKDPEAQAELAGLGADVAVVVAYGLILPKPVLAAPRHGGLNLHGSYLPRWRGAAPIQRAILAGDTETGIMVMRMDEGLDTGPVCLGERMPIGGDMTAGELHDRMATLGADLILRALAALARGSLDCTPPPEAGASYAPKIEKAETRIDWARPAAEVHNHIRGLSPFPGAWCELERDGKRERVKILRSEVAAGAGAPGEALDDELCVACGEGAVRLTQVQRAGKQPAAAAAFLRGFPVPAGARLH